MLLLEFLEQSKLVLPAAGRFTLGLLADTLRLCAVKDEADRNQLLLALLLQLACIIQGALLLDPRSEPCVCVRCSGWGRVK